MFPWCLGFRGLGVEGASGRQGAHSDASNEGVRAKVRKVHAEKAEMVVITGNVHGLWGPGPVLLMDSGAQRRYY